LRGRGEGREEVEDEEEGEEDRSQSDEAGEAKCRRHERVSVKVWDGVEGVQGEVK
jgi:hypothetical protein